MICPMCGSVLIPQGGCYICINCGWAACDNKNSTKSQIIVEGEQKEVGIVGSIHRAKKPVIIEGKRICLLYFNNVN